MPTNTKFELKMGAATREAFGKALVELGEKNPNVVVCDADLSKSTMVHGFAKEFPDRFFSCGIAESNMVAIGSGLASAGKIPFVAIGKAIAAGEPDGFAKLLYGKKHGELLGAHIIGDNATELIAEMGLALDQELTTEEIHATIHAHPTMSEVIHEATLAAEGHAIHF